MLLILLLHVLCVVSFDVVSLECCQFCRSCVVSFVSANLVYHLVLSLPISCVVLPCRCPSRVLFCLVVVCLVCFSVSSSLVYVLLKSVVSLFRVLFGTCPSCVDASSPVVFCVAAACLVSRKDKADLTVARMTASPEQVEQQVDT